MAVVVTEDIINAAKRLLGNEDYKSLKITGDPAEYEQFYKDVLICAEFIAELVEAIVQLGQEMKLPHRVQ